MEFCREFILDVARRNFILIGAESMHGATRLEGVSLPKESNSDGLFHGEDRVSQLLFTL